MFSDNGLFGERLEVLGKKICANLLITALVLSQVNFDVFRVEEVAKQHLIFIK